MSDNGTVGQPDNQASRKGAEAKRGGALKCYQIFSDHVEASVLVWTDNGSHARVMARGRSIWFHACDYVDIRTKRLPNLDNRHDVRHITPDNPTESDWRDMRDAGFFEIDNEGETCAVCHRHEFKALAESKLNDSGVCLGCSSNSTAELSAYAPLREASKLPEVGK